MKPFILFCPVLSPPLVCSMVTVTSPHLAVADFINNCEMDKKTPPWLHLLVLTNQKCGSSLELFSWELSCRRISGIGVRSLHRCKEGNCHGLCVCPWRWCGSSAFTAGEMRALPESGSRGEAARLSGCSAIKVLLSAGPARPTVTNPAWACAQPRPGLCRGGSRVGDTGV